MECSPAWLSPMMCSTPCALSSASTAGTASRGGTNCTWSPAATKKGARVKTPLCLAKERAAGESHKELGPAARSQSRAHTPTQHACTH